jgi:hypothetical protein
MDVSADLLFIPLKSFKTPTERKIEEINQVAEEKIKRVTQLANGNYNLFQIIIN